MPSSSLVEVEVGADVEAGVEVEVNECHWELIHVSRVFLEDV